MAYSDKFGTTEIFNPERCEILSLGWDCQEDEDNLDERYASFLYVPDRDNHDHYHINFSVPEAKIMREWLDSYIQEIEAGATKEPYVHERDWNWAGSFDECVRDKYGYERVFYVNENYEVEDLIEIGDSVGYDIRLYEEMGKTRMVTKLLIFYDNNRHLFKHRSP